MWSICYSSLVSWTWPEWLPFVGGQYYTFLNTFLILPTQQSTRVSPFFFSSIRKFLLSKGIYFNRGYTIVQRNVINRLWYSLFWGKKDSPIFIHLVGKYLKIDHSTPFHSQFCSLIIRQQRNEHYLNIFNGNFKASYGLWYPQRIWTY